MAARALPALLLLCLSLPARAWVDEAHRLVGRIAWGHLRPQTRALVKTLLQQHPEGPLTLAASCLCADHPHIEDSWHWTNRPFFDGVAPRPVHLGQDALWALRQNLAVLGDGSAPLPRRADALAWVGHLVGDIHMPLHCVSRYTPDFPNGDRGGNLFKVLAADGRRMTLHRYWDLGGGVFETGGPPVELNLPPPSYDLDPQNWVQESYKLVSHRLYRGLEVGESVPAGYREWTEDTCRRRVNAAGYRLAWLLERTFP